MSSGKIILQNFFWGGAISNSLVFCHLLTIVVNTKAVMVILETKTYNLYAFAIYNSDFIYNCRG